MQEMMEDGRNFSKKEGKVSGCASTENFVDQ